MQHVKVDNAINVSTLVDAVDALFSRRFLSRTKYSTLVDPYLSTSIITHQLETRLCTALETGFYKSYFLIHFIFFLSYFTNLPSDSSLPLPPPPPHTNLLVTHSQWRPFSFGYKPLTSQRKSCANLFQKNKSFRSQNSILYSLFH